VRISVVIPTLSEASTVAAAIASARESLDACEVIVVDAGSTDATQDIARRAGALVTVATGPRAVAMNAGARLAQGDALLFLHADTTLPDGAGAAVREALRSADGGAFRLRYDERRPVLHVFGDLRARFFQPVYGDQAIFVTRAAFDRIGGFQPVPIMEDCDLVQRLRRSGRFTMLDLSVRTAARRHRRHGTASTVLRVWAIKCLYRVGVSPARLARIYPPAR
jgi:rSAM/selenodomain-associated transferase 2